MRVAINFLSVAALALFWCQSAKAFGPSPFHPFTEDLRCVASSGSAMQAKLYGQQQGIPEELGTYHRGHVGACEFAIGASRGGKICLENNFRYWRYDLTSKMLGPDFGADFSTCLAATKNMPGLGDRPGYVEYIAVAETNVLLAKLPHVDDDSVEQALFGDSTMWYDESSMTYTYQDSFGDPQGLRANRVGFDVGSRATVPDIRLLTNYFEHGKFRFPFGIFAGASTPGVYALNFWLPPKDAAGNIVPVRYWTVGTHWEWTFPVDTVIGEVLFSKSPDGEWLPFEIRARVRAPTIWHSSVWRPYNSAQAMADAIKAMRPNWRSSDLRGLVDHLEDQETLVPHKLSGGAFAKIFPEISGAMDYLPATTDVALIKSLLQRPRFSQANGTIWKSNGQLSTFAASTKADYQVVPKDYSAGMLEVSDESCSRCHNQVSRPLKDLDRRVVLYGEMWGEDQIFTWHLFEVDYTAYGTYDDTRRVNPRLVRAGLIAAGKPSAQDRNYRVIAKPW